MSRRSASTAAAVSCRASSARVTAVGGRSDTSPRRAAAIAAAGASHATSSASPPTSLARWPAGSSAAKKRVSNLRLSKSGVTHRAHGLSRSERSTRPRRCSRPASDSEWSTSERRSASQSSPVVSATTVSGAGPASSTPVSSNTSRTAAHVSARASTAAPLCRPGGTAPRDPPEPRRPPCRILPHATGSGPAQASSACPSRGSTDPPGNTCAPGANAIDRVRRNR